MSWVEKNRRINNRGEGGRGTIIRDSRVIGEKHELGTSGLIKGPWTA